MRGTRPHLALGLAATIAFVITSGEAAEPGQPAEVPPPAAFSEIEDYSGYFSHRALQRSLKGRQFDLQPSDRYPEARHSLRVLNGVVASKASDAIPDNDLYNGASWLFEHAAIGRFLFYGVHNHREANEVAGRPERDQGVFSVAGARGFEAFGQSIRLETEAAQFIGDYDIANKTAEDNAGSGLFLLARGASVDQPLTYSLRLEKVDADFRPHGSRVVPDRQVSEARAGWRFGGDLALEARLQDNSRGSAGKGDLETRIAGLTLSGPLLGALAGGVRGRIDTFVRDQNRDGTIERTTAALNLNLNLPPIQDWSPRLRLHVSSANDAVAETEFLTGEVNLSAGRTLSLPGLEGRLAPGLLLRSVSGGPGASFNIGPSLSLRLHDGPHELWASYKYLHQERRADNLQDLDTHTPSVSYWYQSGGQRFGLQADYSSRSAASGQDTYRVGFVWRLEWPGPQAPDGRIGALSRPSPPGWPAPTMPNSSDGPGIEPEALDSFRVGAAGGTPHAGGSRLKDSSGES